MSPVRMHFWEEVARGKGGSCWPRKYGTNWFMPALVSSRPGTGAISEDDGTTRCPRSSKNDRNACRISFPSMAASVSVPRSDPRGCGHDRDAVRKGAASAIAGDAFVDEAVLTKPGPRRGLLVAQTPVGHGINPVRQELPADAQ